jgi:hypothetical protein
VITLNNNFMDNFFEFDGVLYEKKDGKSVPYFWDPPTPEELEFKNKIIKKLQLELEQKLKALNS